jgi:C1A family cysteine protease
MESAKTVAGGALAVRKVQGYGWVGDLPDARDTLFSAGFEVMTNLPTSVDLRGKMPPVYDQGQLGSCTANAIAAAIEYDLVTPFVPSRLFIYYNERFIEGTVDSDSGARIRDGIKSVGTQGACPEADWQYDITKFAQKPPPPAYADALKTRAVRYYSVVQDIAQMKSCLAQKFPFVFGFTVYSYFESPEMANTGILIMPTGTQQAVGGHAVLAVGYDDSEQTILVRNSWGDAWGMSGYFKMPYAYITSASLASDFWTIRQAT